MVLMLSTAPFEGLKVGFETAQDRGEFMQHRAITASITPGPIPSAGIEAIL